MSDLAELHRRIAGRPASELRSTLLEFKNALPEHIRLEERFEEREGLGQCYFELLIIDDPLLGPRELILHVYQSEGTVTNSGINKLMGSEEVERFREMLDHNGDPLFAPERAKLALLECLSAAPKPVVEKSRKQPEKPITKWLRANIHKYRNRAEAIRNYIELYGGNYHKLYQDAANDFRAKPLRKPGKSG